jgi:hypothetical protein
MGVGGGSGKGAGVGTGVAVSTVAGSGKCAGSGGAMGAGSTGGGVSGCTRAGCSSGGDNSGARGPGSGVFDCRVLGNCVVVLSGTLDSGVLEKTGAFSAWCVAMGGRTVMARLLPDCALGLIGFAY